MRIQIIHNYFYPDVSAVSQLVSDLAFYLSSEGMEVSVICSRGKYTGGNRTNLKKEEVVQGVKIKRVYSPSFGKKSLLVRLLDYISFTIFSSIQALLSRKVDIVILLTNPPLFSLLGVLLKIVKNEKFVYIVEDVYPDIAIQYGILKDKSILAQVLYKLSDYTFRNADKVVDRKIQLTPYRHLKLTPLERL